MVPTESDCPLGRHSSSRSPKDWFKSSTTTVSVLLVQADPDIAGACYGD